MVRSFAIFVIAAVLSACSSQVVQQAPGQSDTIAAGSGDQRTMALLGATGMAGGHILQQALSRGYDVRVLARTPAKLDAYKEKITIVQGDARDLPAIRALLQGSDIVVSALGPVKADGDAALMISTEATGHILKAMAESAISQYIVVSGGAVTVPGDDRNFTGWLMQKMVALTLGDTLQDKQAEYALLAASDVQWTLVRCPVILDEPFRETASASLLTPGSFTLRAGELADFIVRQTDSVEFARKAPFLYSQ